MYIFIDESGCLGLDFNKGKTTRYFVMTALVAQHQTHLRSAVRRTQQNKLGSQSKHQCELKGTHTSFKVKQYFYRQMMKNPEWTLYTVILDKKTYLERHQPSLSKHLLYNELTHMVVSAIQDLPSQHELQIFIDRSKSVKEILVFNQMMREELCQRLPATARVHIEHVPSSQDLSLQAVDMFCYGLSRKYEFKDTAWYDLFSDKITRELMIR